METQSWRVKHPHRNVHVIEFKSRRAKDGDLVGRVLCRSDVHHDHKAQDREMETRHLEEALEQNCPVLGNGDQYDVMQSRYDPRREVQGVRADVAHIMSMGTGVAVPPSSVPYVDALVHESAQYLRPYASQLVTFGRGNHDEAAKKNLGTDPVERLVQELRREGSPVVAGGYSGYFVFRFHIGGTRNAIKLYHYHGHGGSAPVTGGAIDLYRQSAQADADIIWIGHKHTEQERTIPVWGLTKTKLEMRSRERLAFFTPGYVMEPFDGYSGFMTEKTGNTPKPTGQAWLEFRWCRATRTVEVERRRAK